jgi:hypothetical protein
MAWNKYGHDRYKETEKLIEKGKSPYKEGLKEVNRENHPKDDCDECKKNDG